MKKKDVSMGIIPTSILKARVVEGELKDQNLKVVIGKYPESDEEKKDKRNVFRGIFLNVECNGKRLTRVTQFSLSFEKYGEPEITLKYQKRE